MEPSTQPQPNSSIAIPIAIVIGFALIAVAVYFSGSGAPTNPSPTVNQQPVANDVTPDAAIRPITADDHVRGNPNAPIVLIEYTDYDCPFCKSFHGTMEQIMSEYGTTGEVAWVLRHFPLQQLHPNAPLIAQASECVAELAGDNGNEAFWEFSDKIFNGRGINEPTNMLDLPDYAVEVGVDRVAFESCMDSDRHRDGILASVQEGFDAGIRGTPHTVVIVGDEQAVINGAQPYQVVKGIIEDLLAQISGQSPEDLLNAE